MDSDVLIDFSKAITCDSMDRLLEHFAQENVPIDEIVQLTKILAFSGESYTRLFKRVDLASTGGPSSLTTLLCPLYLALFGLDVVKLGIPGRPAGAIDSLAQIKQYKTDYSSEELAVEIKKGGYIHFLASTLFTPADAILYDYRKKKGKVSIPNIAIASLLSKKLAMGLSTVGLDVRVSPYGNFGHNVTQATSYAKIFCKVANELSINAACFISDASNPYQPYLGRGESLLALSKIFNGLASPWLEEHKNYCRDISTYLFETEINVQQNFDLSDQNIKVAFEQNLLRQNGVLSEFIEYCNYIEGEHKIEIIADSSGYCYYDLDRIRRIFVCIQTSEASVLSKFPDPCGIIFCIRPGTHVVEGEILATMRLSNGYYLQYRDELDGIVNILKTPKALINIENEVITYG